VRRLAGLSFSTLDESGRKIPFGMGLTGGRVLAGNMATKEHIKYIVMGSAVNIASRLEGLTKHIRVPVLIGGSTARMVQGKTKLRRVAKVQPAGMASVLDAYELVLPEDCHGTGISDHNIEKYECALGCFEQGEMEKAEELLQALPVSDPVRRFLLLQAGQLIYSGVPPGWDGVIRFHSK
jgi:adenylate cyclase